MKTIIIILAITIVTIVAFSVVNAVSADIASQPATTSLAADGNSFTISGAVNHPGTYVLSSGAKMADLIAAASGTTSNADTLAFNTDYILTAKGSYYIAPIYDNGNNCAVTPIEKVNVNSGSAEDLQSKAGFGKAAANALVSYRATNTFQAIEEIKNVPGIGDATFVAVRDKITLKDKAA